MYYFLLILAAVCVSTQFNLMKLYQTKVKLYFITSLFFNLITALVTVIFLFIINNFKLNITAFSLVMAFLFAITTSFNNIIGIKVMSIGKISVFTVFMMLGGMFLPFVYGLIFLNEAITSSKIIGILLLIVSLFIPMLEKDGEKIVNKKLFYKLCFAVFFMDGAVTIIMKSHQNSVLAVNSYEFLMLSNILAFILSGVIIAFMYNKAKDKTKTKNLLAQSVKVKNLSIIIMFAIASGTGGILQLISAIKLPASVLFPIVTGGTIVFATIFGLIFFKEKLTKPVIIGLLLTFAATIFFMF